MGELASGLLAESEMSLFVDYYELTSGKADFDHKNNGVITENYFFRKIPQGSYIITVGLEQLIHYIQNIRFTEEDLQWLKETSGKDLSDEFLNYLKSFKFSGDVYAAKEGTPVFVNEPVINVTGPSIDVQIFETYLLNVMNYQSLIATKAVRLANAAKGRTILDFGARRAHGRDAAILGVRAAYIGGLSATSLVVAAKKWKIPYVGTMPHKFIQDRPAELQAFKEYAESFPHNAILLIDTYDTILGAKNAVTIGKELRKKGYDLKGVRLDSGDMLSLSKEVRRILDEDGFKNTKIYASSDLDEFKIADFISKGAPIDGFGVGTALITGANYNSITKEGGISALNGVYKMVENTDKTGKSIPKIKTSEDKILLPGRKQVCRKIIDGKYVADMITLWDEKPKETNLTPLLVPVICEGRLVYKFPAVSEIKEYCSEQLAMLPDKYKDIHVNLSYPVSISTRLAKVTDELIRKYSRHPA